MINFQTFEDFPHKFLLLISSLIVLFSYALCNFFFFLVYFIFGCVGSSFAVRVLSLVAASGVYSLLRCAGFSLRWLLLLWSTGSRRAGFGSCGMLAQQLWHMGSRAQAQ